MRIVAIFCRRRDIDIIIIIIVVVRSDDRADHAADRQCHALEFNIRNGAPIPSPVAVLLFRARMTCL
jgi:hypothetical protein